MRLPVLVLLAFAIAAPSAAAAAKPYDFDGDGRQELVAGLPELRVDGKKSAGAILVGPRAPRTLIAAPGGAGEFDRFGRSLASGDFNADGFADLAVGSDEWEPARIVDRGGVTVLYGSAAGITTTGAVQFFGTPEIVVEAGESFEHGTGFGATLAAGDLNRDGAADLVVGAIQEKPKPVSDTGSGAIRLLFGGATGLTRSGERVLARPRRDDTAFGFAIALGDVNRDGHLDIVEGADGQASSVDFEDIAGHLSYCGGAATAPAACRAVSPRQRSNTGGSGRTREAPASLSVGDVTGDGFADIVEGVPEDRVHGEDSRSPTGAILIRRGTSRGPSKRVLRITQAARGVPGQAEERDAFGATVAVGRIDRDRFADIVVGATGENRGRGRVTVLRGGSDGVRARGAREYDRDTRGMPRTGLELGAALTLLDHNGDRRLDLTIGSRKRLITLFGRRRAFATQHAIGIGPLAGLGSVLGR